MKDCSFFGAICGHGPITSLTIPTAVPAAKVQRGLSDAMCHGASNQSQFGVE
jgi:hypothetical protein